MLVNEDNFSKCIDKLEPWRYVVLDLETTGLRPWSDQITGVAVQGWAPRQHSTSMYFPVGHGVGANITKTQLSWLVQLLNTKIQIGYNNANFDSLFLYDVGGGHDIAVRDVMCLAHLVNENEPKSSGYSLKGLAVKYVRPDADAESKALDKLLTERLLQKNEMHKLPPELVEPYACADVDITRELMEFYLPHAEKRGLLSVWTGVSEYAAVVGHMRRTGVYVDPVLAGVFIKHSEAEMLRITMEVTKLAGRRINLSSPQAIKKWLGLQSSAEAVLETLDQSDPRVAALRLFRRHMKAIGSYYRPIRETNIDGVIHPELSVIGTITGRLSCRGGVNFLALPRDTQIYRVKELVVARPGYTLVAGDYQRAELCVASHFGEPRMAELLRQGVNIHEATADSLSVGYDLAKRLNFSIVYGISPETFADRMHIPIKQAEDYLSRYRAQYPGFKRLYNRADHTARMRGYIKHFTGRRRNFNRGDSTPTHKALSNLIQGTVAEIMRLAQMRLHNELKGMGVRQLLQVYDSAVMETPTDKLHDVLPLVRALMEDNTTFSVPLRVDISFGPSLAVMQKYEEA